MEKKVQNYLILKLKGAMQSWGGHTYEDYRPSLDFPTRSGLVGLLGACLGIRHQELESHKLLDASLRFAVRADERDIPIRKLVDFHTVKNAPRTDGSVLDYAVITRREYLLDAEFTVAIESTNKAQPSYSLDKIKQAVRKPVFVPYLGRKSCPISRPLFEMEVQANNLIEALSLIEPNKGIIYSEEEIEGTPVLTIRDRANYNGKRHFYKRNVWIKN